MSPSFLREIRADVTRNPAMKKSLILILALSPIFSTTPPAASLPPLNLEQEITLSGVSSGAFFAVQFHIAHSSWVKGVGVVAGGIFGCSKGYSQRGFQPCMADPGRIEPEEHIRQVHDLAQESKIDEPKNLADDKVFIFQSHGDKVVRFPAAEKLIEFYSSFLPEESISLMAHDEAAHGFPVNEGGNACEEFAPPYLQNCGIDGAGEILLTLLGKLNPPGAASKESLLSFSQEEFGAADALLHKEGFLYIPAACRAGEKCRLHIAFHGCRQNQDFADAKFREGAGYNHWAETNRIVVLYPSAGKSKKNPFGCWDWLGLTGPDYLNKLGPQMAAIRRMVESLHSATR